MGSKGVLELFERINPRSAAHLSLVETSGLDTVTSQAQEAIFFDRRKKNPYPLHNLSGALLEGQEWFSSLKINHCDAIVVFGVGSGWHLLPILHWLDGDPYRRLVVYEDDLAILSLFLETQNAQIIIKHPQVLLLHYEEGNEGDLLFEKIAWALFQRHFIVATLPSYAAFRPKRMAKLQERLVLECAEVEAVLDEYMAFGVPCFKNFWRNIRFCFQAKNGTALFNQFKGQSAVIVGAGPSLESDLELISKLQDRCLILAGGSSLSILSEAGITPHLAAGVDPNPPQYMRLRQSQMTVCPFVFSSRILHEALDQILGPLLYIRGGEGYGLSRWIERASGITGPFIDGGHSVTNLLVELAYALGCRNLSLVGMDLAYTDNKLYPQMVEHALGSDESRFIGDEGRYMRASGTAGDTVITESKWITEADWISRFRARHPRLNLVNSTPRGLQIQGLAFQSLADFSRDFSSQNLYGLVGEKIQAAPPLVLNPSRLLRAIDRYKKSLYRMKEKLINLKKTLHRIKDVEEAFLWEEQLGSLHSEPFYQALGRDFDMMFTKLSRAREFLALGHHWTQKKAIALRHEDERLKLELYEKVIRTQSFILEASVHEWMVFGVSMKGLSSFPKEYICLK